MAARETLQYNHDTGYMEATIDGRLLRVDPDAYAESRDRFLRDMGVADPHGATDAQWHAAEAENEVAIHWADSDDAWWPDEEEQEG